MSIIFNKDKEIRVAYNALKHIGLNQNGIIFGGMVRDEIIATHNKALFNEYIKLDESLYNKFWDKSFHVETINRMRVPNDMDIYFKNNNDAEKFMVDIQNFNKLYGGRIVICDRTNSRALFYTIGNECMHKKIIITLRLGKTLTFNGHKIQLNIDMIINNYANYKFEPPFNACDFSCNVFIMVKSSTSTNYDIRLSNNTGTPLDDLDYFNKKKMEVKIIDELLQGRIEFIRNIQTRNTEYINGFRIMKMLHKNEYKITNLLFRDFEKTDEEKIEKSTCDICMCDIEFAESEELIEILTNKHYKNIMHKKCFINYLDKEIGKKYVNTETNQIECRCSRRNSFNFKNSYKFSFLYK